MLLQQVLGLFRSNLIKQTTKKRYWPAFNLLIGNVNSKRNIKEWNQKDYNVKDNKNKEVNKPKKNKFPQMQAIQIR